MTHYIYHTINILFHQRQTQMLPSIIALMWLIFGVHSSMTIINKSGYRLYVTLDQVSTLYHDILEDNQVMHRNTGAVHFTVTAKVIDEHFVPPSTGQIIARHIEIVSSFVSKKRPTDLLQELEKKPQKNKFFSSAGWYAGKDHILSIWGGVHSPLSVYSCRNQEYYPQKYHDYVYGTDICSKFDTDRQGGRYDL